MEKKIVITDGEIDLIRPEYEDSEDSFWFDIYLHDTNTRIGEVIYDDEWRNQELYGNVGYSINDEYQGHNYARKALELLKQLLIGKKEKIILNIFDGNIASIKTAEKFGAKIVRYGKIPRKYNLGKHSGYDGSYTVYEYKLPHNK